eukprot:12423065-Karenia_brevis.AAC.1
MLAVDYLCLFCQCVLEPAGLLPQHCRCLLLLKWCMDILFGGDSALKFVEHLERLFMEHHDLYLQLYGVLLAKPKFHLCFHLPEQLKRFNLNANCFKPERMHQLVKQLGRHAKPVQVYESSILKRICGDMLDSWPDWHFQEFSLPNAEPGDPKLRQLLLPLHADTGHTIYVCKSMRHTIGMLSAGDMISIQTAGGLQLGQLTLCASASKLLTPSVIYFVAFHPFTETKPGVFKPQSCAEKWCLAQHVGARMIYKVVDEGRHYYDRSVCALLSWGCMTRLAG